MKGPAVKGVARNAGARSRVPTLRTERSMLRDGCRLVAGMDEVGRGALAGPVSVGVVVVHEGTRTAPSGVRDSKLLTPAARQALVPRLRRWAAAFAVGHAQPEEIDRYGIIAALRLAGHRALLALPELPDAVLLDGSHDWLTPPVVLSGSIPGTGPDEDARLTQELLFDVPPVVLEPVVVREPAPLPELDRRLVVSTMVKADLRCAAVAAASVLAKVERDAMMVERSRLYPGYGWHENKGYAAPEHSAALRELGTCEQHRRSWNLSLAEPEPAEPERIEVGG